MQELCSALKLTQWQLIILGLAAITELGKLDEAKLREMATDIGGRYSKGKRSEGMERQ